MGFEKLVDRWAGGLGFCFCDFMGERIYIRQPQ
jgi:hypothetical protein